jgi:hypothetical protein
MIRRMVKKKRRMKRKSHVVAVASRIPSTLSFPIC